MRWFAFNHRNQDQELYEDKNYGAIEESETPDSAPTTARSTSSHKALHSARSRYSLRRSSAMRDKWGSKVEFLLAVIGFAVDLGNVWRFPYICYRNGGGAFLIPYLTMFLFGGLPLFYMELCLGQYHRSGCISIWKRICPLFKGIGFAICIIATYMAFFYNTIISWAVYFFFASFTWKLPWSSCNNTWNTLNCSVDLGATLEEYQETIYNVTLNLTRNNSNSHLRSPAEEYYLYEVLEIQKSTGFSGMGSIKYSLAFCLLIVYVVVYFALWKGPRSSGKAVWITATMPYIVLVILLIRGVTLPGASIGIHYYLTPNWDRLYDKDVWIDAATQIFFSLGPGFGVLLALSSYNEFHNDCCKDAIITSLVNCFTSFLSGFVIFSTLGYMSHILGKDIDQVAGEGGAGLIFVVYPQAIATMDYSPFWSIIFFFMLFTLGIDSTFGGLEAMITAFCDEFPNTIGKRRELFVLCLVVYCYMGSLPTTTYGGKYLVDFFDHYGVSFSILFVVAVETIAVCRFYGVTRLSEDVKEMLGTQPGFLWRVCWSYISPLFISTIFGFACYGLAPVKVKDYDYPDWSKYVGWLMVLSSLGCIPGFMIYKICFTMKGTLLHRLKESIKPIESRRNASQSHSLSFSANPAGGMSHTSTAQALNNLPTFSHL